MLMKRGSIFSIYFMLALIKVYLQYFNWDCDRDYPDLSHTLLSDMKIASGLYDGPDVMFLYV